MKILLKTTILVFGVCITHSSFGYIIWRTPHYQVYVAANTFTNTYKEDLSKMETMNRLQQKAAEAKEYVSNNGFNEGYCFLIDMRLPSGKNRFFVYNLREDAVETSGLVAHGKGSEKGAGALTFSNVPNSLCTSLGKYKLGKSYNGNFGLSYKLYGLENTNSKAFDRNVVLHSYCGVPGNEVYPARICESEGCPTISPDFLVQVKTFMDASKTPIMLWIYY